MRFASENWQTRSTGNEENKNKSAKIRENGRKRVKKFREKEKYCNVTETLSNTEEKNRIDKNEKKNVKENESGFKE